MSTNFLKRLISGILLYLLLVALLFKGSNYLIFAVILLCALLSWYEWTNFFQFSTFYFIWGGALIVLALVLNPCQFPLAIFGLLLLLSFFPFLFNFAKDSFSQKFFPFFLGIFYLVLGLAPFLFLITYYPRTLLFFFFSVIFTTDIGAYFTGKFLGKHSFFPQISSKKTWEGFTGGLLFSLFIAFLLNHILHLWSLKELLILTIGLSIAGVLGDLFESAVKRVCDKKDSSNLIPGHGGILDRIDSILLASPIFLFFLEVLNYGTLHRLGL